MKKLIEALQIFLKYDDPDFPTHCEHDVLAVVGDYDPDQMDPKDVKKLGDLGFFWSDDSGTFVSFMYGSA